MPDLPRAKAHAQTKNAPPAQTRAQAARSLGVDLVAVLGRSASSVQTIGSEIGTDMSRFPSVKHVGAWLGLAPRNDSSGGKRRRARTAKVVNRAGYPLGEAFRQAAQAVARSDAALGAYYRAMRARKGPHQATVATAHKLARIVYHLLKYGAAYAAERAAASEHKRQERALRQLSRRAQKLGYTRTPAVMNHPDSTTEPGPGEGFLRKRVSYRHSRRANRGA